MNTKDNQRSRLTRMLLRQSYLRLMNEKTAAKITVKEICEGAEVNRSTFYLHYSEPNDILKELEDEAIALMTESLSSIGAQNGDYSNARLGLITFLGNVRKNDDLFRMLLVENSDPHFCRKLRTVVLNMAETAFMVDIEPELRASVYLFIISGSMELLAGWIRSGYAMPESTLCDTLFRLSEGCLRPMTLH